MAKKSSGRLNLVVLIVWLIFGVIPGIIYAIFQGKKFSVVLCVIGFIFGIIPGIVYLLCQPK